MINDLFNHILKQEMMNMHLRKIGRHKTAYTICQLKDGKGNTDLNSRMHLMHELKQFVDHGFQKLPMSSEKSWILTNNIPNNYIINQPNNS